MPADSIYDQPRIYDLAFSGRNIEHEVDVLLAWHRQVSGGRRPKAVLELAAGPARHARALARRGTPAVALDLSSEMCAYARRHVRRTGAPFEAVVGDMCDFQLDRRFDLALLMLDSASHILSFRSMVRHLESVRRHLRAGGVYIIELALQTGPNQAPTTRNRWTVTRGDNRVRVQWGRMDDPMDGRWICRTTVRLSAMLASPSWSTCACVRGRGHQWTEQSKAQAASSSRVVMAPLTSSRSRGDVPGA
jgi:SAM-dependent methyltransferase